MPDRQSRKRRVHKVEWDAVFANGLTWFALLHSTFFAEKARVVEGRGYFRNLATDRLEYFGSLAARLLH